MNSSRRDVVGKMLTAVCCWGVAAFFFSLPWLATDTLIHVKMGERIVREAGFPREDIFSFGQTKPIESTQWLSEVIFYYTYHSYGEPGLRFLKTLLGLLSLFWVFRLSRLLGARFTAANLFMLGTTFLIAYFLNARPRQFSLVLLPIAFEIFLRSQKRPPLLFAYLPLKLLWANLHAEYLVADALLLVLIIAQAIERLFPHLPEALSKDPAPPDWLKLAPLVLFLSWLLNLANPYTGRTLSEEAISAPAPALKELLTEWVPLQLLNPLNYHVIAYLLFALVIFLLVWRSITFAQALAFLFLWVLPFIAQRTVPTTAVLTAPLLACWVGELLRPGRLERLFSASRIGRRLSILLAPQVLVPALALFGSVYMFQVPFASHLRRGLFEPQRYLRSMHPVDAVSFIRLNRPPGRMYNDFDWGAYLIFHLYPDYQVALDARYTAVYREDYLQEAMNVMYGHPDWEKFLDKHKISWVLIKQNRPLYGLLDRSRRWVWIYEDDWAAIFMRRGKVTEDFLKRAFEWKLSYPRSAIFERGFGAALVRRGEFDRALDFLLRAQKKLPEDPRILDWMAVAYIGKGERDRALQALKEAINVDPSYANAHAHLALWYAEEGQVDSARRHAEEALRHDPHNPIALDIKEALSR